MVIQNNKIKRNKCPIYYPPVLISAFILSGILLAKPSRKSESDCSQQCSTASDISFLRAHLLEYSTRVWYFVNYGGECAVLIKVGGFGGNELVFSSWVGALVLQRGLLCLWLLPSIRNSTTSTNIALIENQKRWNWAGVSSKHFYLAISFQRCGRGWKVSKIILVLVFGWFQVPGTIPKGWRSSTVIGLSWPEPNNTCTSTKYFLSYTNFLHGKGKRLKVGGNRQIEE